MYLELKLKKKEWKNERRKNKTLWNNGKEVFWISSSGGVGIPLKSVLSSLLSSFKYWKSLFLSEVSGDEIEESSSIYFIFIKKFEKNENFFKKKKKPFWNPPSLCGDDGSSLSKFRFFIEKWLIKIRIKKREKNKYLFLISSCWPNNWSQSSSMFPSTMSH